MGKRGPKPESVETLRARGSTLLPRRSRESRALPDAPALVRDVPRRPAPPTEDAWRQVLRMLPGFDPYALRESSRFDAARANAAVDWMEEHIVHVKGALAGTHLRLEDWQRAIVGNLFGWLRPDGSRRFRKGLVYVPRKNGKTSLSSAVALYVLFCDGEGGAEVYAAAAKREQARLLWDLSRRQVERDAWMSDRAKTYQASIVVDGSASFYQPLAAEGRLEHGRSTHLAIIDELHAQANADLVEALDTSVGARRQPIILYLTTADVVGDSVCNDVLKYAKAVRDNPGDRSRPGYDPTFLPAIWEASVEDDWTAVDTWRKANPNLGVSVSEAFLSGECQKAKDLPSYTNAFRRWYLNVQTETATAWLRAQDWDACGAAFDVHALRGRECWAGLDLSSTTDMTALVLYFPDGQYVLPWFWVPKDTAKERDRRNDPLYLRWAGTGHLTLTEGNVIDYDLIHRQIDALAGEYRIQQIGIDPWNSRQVSLDLMKRGYQVVEVRQGPITFNEPSKRLESMVRAGTLRHGGHPVLRWNAQNVKVKTDERGNIAPVKSADAAKVDGIVALVMAIRLAGDRKGEPVFDEASWVRSEPLEF